MYGVALVHFSLMILLGLCIGGRPLLSLSFYGSGALADFICSCLLASIYIHLVLFSG